ncbi:hypothetical protein, partial [Bosea sp. (in: a-proteobacteria)]|uniref:hypothetical protein n=1 Tax=Bosea sp. (in: a-proteobacteria) TaxID=1871050 RepID=UPI0040347214
MMAYTSESKDTHHFWCMNKGAHGLNTKECMSSLMFWIAFLLHLWDPTYAACGSAFKADVSGLV